MKWLKLLLLALILGCLLTPVVAQATNPVVHITVSAWVVGTSSGLTITYVNDYQVDLEWTKGEAAANTMVRAKYGSMPTSRTDGYEVYYGDGTSCSDTGVNFEESASTVYYRLFSQNGAGAWEDEGISGFLENPNMTLIAFFLFCGIMSFLGLRSTYYILKFLSGLCWMALGMYWLSNPPSTVVKGSAVDTGMIVLLFVIGVAMMIMPFWYSKRTPSGEETGEGRLRLPFMPREEEEVATRERKLPTRSERTASYMERLDNRIRGGRPKPRE
jgi:hypothetical protein